VLDDVIKQPLFMENM